MIELVKNPRRVKELLSEAIENERDRKRVSVREFMSDNSDEVDAEDFQDDMEINP